MTASLSPASVRSAEELLARRGVPETFCTDHWRCRLLAEREGEARMSELVDLLARLDRLGLGFIKTEALHRFNGEPGYSLGQGR